MTNNTRIQKNFKSFAIFLLLLSGALLFLSKASWAGDINAVFTDINTKTESLLSFTFSVLVYIFCACCATYTLVGIMLKKMSWDEAIRIIVIIICLGFVPSLVAWLLNK